jgi:Subtilisin-like serine proteases
MNLRSALYFSVILLHYIFVIRVSGQDVKNVGNTTAENKYYNWYNLDPLKDKTVGIGTERAYNELLKGKTLTSVIVAVIDGGVDIKHEDLQGKIWVNKGEIPGNGIDDDHNGYVDDVNGWNFIGGPEGKDIEQETLELTRLYKKYSDKFKGVDKSALSENDLKEYTEYEKIKSKYLEKANKALESFQNIQNFTKVYKFSDSIISSMLHKTDYNYKDIKKIKTGDNEQLKAIKKFLCGLYKNGFNAKEYDDYLKYTSSRINYQFNYKFNPRSIVGDNPEVWNDKAYGNNDIIGPKPDHGTFVSGIIAGNRHNNLGIKGIADSVKIMVVRAIPDGDERDKDVANAIIYAVNNGAQIINMSFGKDYSPQKKFVDDALELAESRGVLIVHAAGNDAENIDTMAHYPNNFDLAGKKIMDSWITVGASSQKPNKELAGSFSNYGKKEVDLFAPGVRIYSSKPDNRYEEGDGTSFAAPMVTGAAALLKSVYPSLTAAQLREILLKSSTKYPKLKVYQPNDNDDKNNKRIKVAFESLSQTGGVLDVYEALKLAGQYVNSK